MVDLGDRVLRPALGAEPVASTGGSPPRRSAPAPASGMLARPGPGRSGSPAGGTLPPALGIIRSRTGSGAKRAGLQICPAARRGTSSPRTATMERAVCAVDPGRACTLGCPAPDPTPPAGTAGSATRLNRSSNRRSGSSAAQRCSLVWIPSTRRSASRRRRPRLVGIHRRPPGIPVTSLPTCCRPFAM